MKKQTTKNNCACEPRCKQDVWIGAVASMKNVGKQNPSLPVKTNCGMTRDADIFSRTNVIGRYTHTTRRVAPTCRAVRCRVQK